MKKIISVLVLVSFLMILGLSVSAADAQYNVEYKEVNLYRSTVQMEKDYETTLVKVETLKGPVLQGIKQEKSMETRQWKCEIGNKVMGIGDTEIFPKLEDYQIKIMVGNNVLATKEGTLGYGVNQITMEIEKSFMSQKYTEIHRFTIMTKEKTSNRIDEKTFKWEKVDKSIFKWVHQLKYGKKFFKKDIALGQTVQTPDKWAMGNTFFYIGNKPSKVFYTDNRDLLEGDNKLSTKTILYQNDKMKQRYWFKVEFIVNCMPVKPTTTTPSTTPTTTVTPTNTITPTTVPPTTVPPTTVPPTTVPGTDTDTLPKTGESSPFGYVLIGLSLFVVGAVIFAVKKNRLEC